MSKTREKSNLSAATCQKLAVFLTCTLLTACASTPEPKVEVRTVNVAVPVPCQVEEPKRPSMPLDEVRPGVTLDQFVAHALAEREVRNAYEGELLVALRACKSL